MTLFNYLIRNVVGADKSEIRLPCRMPRTEHLAHSCLQLISAYSAVFVTSQVTYLNLKTLFSFQRKENHKFSYITLIMAGHFVSFHVITCRQWRLAKSSHVKQNMTHFFLFKKKSEILWLAKSWRLDQKMTLESLRVACWHNWHTLSLFITCLSNDYSKRIKTSEILCHRYSQGRR